MDLFEYAEAQLDEQEDQKEKVIEKEDEILSVAEITYQIKTLLKAKFGLSPVWVRGELSNYKGRNQSGHMYFRLKDENAILNCVFFRNANQNLSVELKEGSEILVRGRLDVWEKGGSYQLVVQEIRAGGIGELYLRFEQLKRKLERDGLFSSDRKKPIPEHPKRIGVVTSSTGAVIRDIIHVARARSPMTRILLLPVKVQGEGSAEEISRAIEVLNHPKYGVDVLIVGRGGGSIEDLWAFNEEIVARAIANSMIPVISAVGHQTDFTIADFVSDVRAATPSQAAELAVPNMREVYNKAELFLKSMVRDLVQSKNHSRESLRHLMRSSVLRDPRILLDQKAQRLDLAMERMIARSRRSYERYNVRMKKSIERISFILPRLVPPKRLRFEGALRNVNLLNPLAILSRGYSVVRDANQRILKDAHQVKPKDLVSITLHQGELECQVTKISKA